MKTATLTIELLSWWHAGSGLGRGGDVDALVIRDADGLPYLPGRTIKGLLRDAVRLAEDFSAVPIGSTDTLFGKADQTTPNDEGTQLDYDPEPRPPGQIKRVSNATLPMDLATWIRNGGSARKAAVYSAFSSTRISPDGVAEQGTLRTIEVCPPLTLSATVAGPDDGTWLVTLEKCVPLVRALGSHRHRGLGRCQMRLTSAAPAIGATGTGRGSHTVAGGCVWLDIELMSDVIVSQSAASTGGHESLGYLPGSVLFGAAAATWFKQPGFGPDVFLSGRIRFTAKPQKAGEEG